MNKEFQIEYLKQQISEKYPSNFITRSIGMSYFTEHQNMESITYKKREQTIGLVIYRNKKFQILLLAVTAFILFTFPFLIDRTKYQNLIVSICLLCISSIIYSIYSILKPRKIFIKTYEEYFVLDKDRKIRWEDILVTGIWSIPGRSINSRFAILGMTSGEIIQINPELTDITADDIIKIVHLNTQNKNVV